MIARKPATNKGTKIASAARIPATTIMNAAAIRRNWAAGDWKEDPGEGVFMRVDSKAYPVNGCSYDTDFWGSCLERLVRKRTGGTGMFPVDVKT